MANLTALTSTTGGIGGESFGILYHVPADQSKAQPLIIQLHGIGEYGDGTLATVRDLEVSGVGPMAISKTTPWPQFAHPLTGELFQFYWVAPQLANLTAGTVLWKDSYIIECIRWAKANMNINPNRIYLTGLSLGGGGTVTAIVNPVINRQIAAAWAICPGYIPGVQSAYDYLASSGLPLTICHAADDAFPPGANPSNSRNFINKVNAARPLYSPRYYEFTTGGHIIWNSHVYKVTPTSYPMSNGYQSTAEPGIFHWFLLQDKYDFSDPYYV